MSIKCEEKECGVVSYNEDSSCCPGCGIDKDGHDMKQDAEVEDRAAREYEEWAQCAKQDDWDEYYSMRDSITYNDAGEPRGYM